jgi:hypothetical protein
MSFVATAVTTGFNAFTQIQAGKFAQGQANLQASQEDYQATVERENALATARIIRRAGERQAGQANAGYAASGVVVGQGSAGDVERQITEGYEHDAYQAILEGNRRARGLETDAELTRIQGRMQRTAGYVNAVGTVLGGAYQGLRAAGWRSAGPGFAGTQAPAPVTDLSTYSPGVIR